MNKNKKPSPSKQRRSRNRLNKFNEMVKKAVYLNYHYPGLDIRPVRNYFGGETRMMLFGITIILTFTLLC